MAFQQLHPDICTPDSEMQVPHHTETIKWLYRYKTETIPGNRFIPGKTFCPKNGQNVQCLFLLEFPKSSEYFAI